MSPATDPGTFLPRLHYDGNASQKKKKSPPPPPAPNPAGQRGVARGYPTSSSFANLATTVYSGDPVRTPYCFLFPQQYMLYWMRQPVSSTQPYTRVLTNATPQKGLFVGLGTEPVRTASSTSTGSILILVNRPASTPVHSHVDEDPNIRLKNQRKPIASGCLLRGRKEAVLLVSVLFSPAGCSWRKEPPS